MTPEPLVSIVTPSFNQGSFIRATIESVLTQTYPRVEYLVIDGGSTDETLSVLGDYDDRVCWISEPDGGQADAINKGFRRAHGEIVTWLNSDDLLVPQAAELAVEAFAEHPTAGFVYGDAYTTDEHGYLRAIVQAPEPSLWALANVVDYVLQPAAFFRRAALAEVGWIHPTWHWAMDWDVFMRLSLAFPTVHVPAVLAYARIHDEAKTSLGGFARFAEIDRFIRTYSARRFPSAFWRYGLETVLLGVGARFRRLTAAVGLDPTVPGMILESTLKPRRAAHAGSLDMSPEHGLQADPLTLLGWMAAHPVRTLYPDLRPLRRRHEARYVDTKTRWGQKMIVSLPDEVSEGVLRLGYHSPDITSFLIRHLRRDMTVLDVGAHIGYFTLLSADCVGPNGAVHAFEPTSSTADILRSNVARHRHVRVVEAAAWNRGGVVEFNDYGRALSTSNSASDLRLPALSGGPKRRTVVASLTLDSYCRDGGLRPDLVKIHALGGEAEILEGMTGVIEGVRPALAIFLSDIATADAEPAEKLVANLIARGYRAYEPLGGLLEPHQPRRLYSSTNLVFLP
jgi:FkbM family methyltransferase